MPSDAPPKLYGFFGLLWRLVVCGTFVFGLAAVGGYFAVQKLVRTPETQAPDLLTMPLDEAVSSASKEGFSIILSSRERTELLPPGQVLSQRPEPGTWVKTGSTIRLTVADKP